MSDKLFRTLTIGGVTYTLNDTTKLEKPTNNGTAGQILVKTDEGSMWQNSSTDTISYNDLTDLPVVNGSELKGNYNFATLVNGKVPLEQLPEMGGGGNHIGSIFAHPSAKPPAGAFLLNGQTIYNCAGTYEEFWVWLQEEMGEMVDVPLYKPWTQPALIENGTMGGDTYAARVSNEVTLNGVVYEAWKSFSNSTTDGGYASSAANGTFPQYLEFYSPVKLKLQKIVLNASITIDYNFMKGYIIKASNNGTDWTTLLTGEIQKTSVTYGEQFELLIPEDLQAGPEYGWNYLRIEVTSNYGDTLYVDYPKVFITAQQYYRTAQVSNGYIRVIDAQYYEDTIAQYGICGAFVVSENDVRLPTWKGYQTPLGNSVPVKGNGMTLGLTNGSSNVNLTGGAPGSSYLFTGNNYGGSISSNSAVLTSSNGSLGVTEDAEKSGIIADTSGYPQDGFHWCIQVFNVATELSQQESAQLASQMQMKAQTDLANVSNPVQAFKTMAIGWGMPDYSAGVETFMGGEPYVAPYRCWAMITLSATDSYGYATVNGQYVFHHGGSYNNTSTTMIVLEEGDTVITYGSSTITIFPMKGADR